MFFGQSSPFTQVFLTSFQTVEQQNQSKQYLLKKRGKTGGRDSSVAPSFFSGFFKMFKKNAEKKLKNGFQSPIYVLIMKNHLLHFL